MARHNGISEENLSAELYQVRRLLQRKEEQGHTITTTKEFLSLMRPYRDGFIDLYKLICISLTLPVTSVSCEHSFSCLRRLKNYLRNTSGDSRTSNLALLAINTVRTRTLDSDKIIDAFALNHNNRRIVLTSVAYYKCNALMVEANILTVYSWLYVAYLCFILCSEPEVC